MTHNAQKKPTIPVHNDWIPSTATFTTWHYHEAIRHVAGFVNFPVSIF